MIDLFFVCNFTLFLHFITFLFSYKDIEIIEDGAKHTLTLYNCKVPQSGEVSFQGANAKCSANLKVKGTVQLLFVLCH